MTRDHVRLSISRFTLGMHVNYALKAAYYVFEQCSKTEPFMLKIMLTKSRLCQAMNTMSKQIALAQQ